LIGWLVLDEVRGEDGEGVRLWGFDDDGGGKGVIVGEEGRGKGQGVGGCYSRCEENGNAVDLLGGVRCYCVTQEVGLGVDVDPRCGEVSFGVTVEGWCWASGRSRCEV
jgi:hypothetical protein